MTGFYPVLAENLVLPLYDIARGTSRFKYGHILRKSQWFSHEQITRLQNHNLRILLKHAYETVPYYRTVFKESGLTPDDIRNPEDLVKLPTLTKADIRNHFDDMVSQEYPKNKLVRTRSGGTGDPITFFATKEQQSWELAAEFRAYGWAGYRLGDRCMIFWGSPLDTPKVKDLVHRITSTLDRTLVANTFVFSEEILDSFGRIMSKFRPQIVRGYAGSVYIMARYMLENPRDWPQPRAVITSAEMLLEHQKETVESAFKCPVFDFYGSREIGAIASKCEENNGYHISAENVLVECVKDGEHVSPGEAGVTLITNLRNFGMPFIRYEIGDVAKLGEDECACGRGLPLLSSVEGRVSQFMAVFDKRLNRVVPVNTVPGFFGVELRNVLLERYMIIQESLQRIVIKVAKGKDYSESQTDLIVSKIRGLFGDDISIDVEFVDYLPPLPSGKRSVFISKIDPFKLQFNDKGERC